MPENSLPSRRLGGLAVSALGLGCMGMSFGYGPGDRDESLATLHQAIDDGITLLDTRRAYLAENLGAAGVELTPGQLDELSGLRAAGDRYPDMTWVKGKSARDPVSPGAPPRAGVDALTPHPPAGRRDSGRAMVRGRAAERGACEARHQRAAHRPGVRLLAGRILPLNIVLRGLTLSRATSEQLRQWCQSHTAANISKVLRTGAVLAIDSVATLRGPIHRKST